ncbi:MAG: hypothetical protein LUC48_00805 [Clostridiales bacterium]|nr:hypothetical protein [Clostridiales bacterium]
MKKQVSLLLAVALMAALLVGCGRVADDEDTLEEAASSAASQAEESSATSSSAASAEAEAEEASEAEPETEAEPWLTIDNTDAYDSAYTFSVPEDGSYAFTVSNADGAEVTWEVYVLEEAFEDATRYIPQAYAPCLTESGTLTLTAGSQVYCICSVNAFTGDPLDEGSSQMLVFQTVEEVASGTFSEALNDSADSSADGVVITSEDAFDSCYAFEATESGTYSFTIQNAEGSEDVTWEVYVLDEAFDEAPRYLRQAQEPSLTGEGSLEITGGSWVYCFCSVNSYTNALDEVTGVSTLTYTIQ